MKLKRVIAIACTAAMTASLISGCGGSSDEGQKEAVKEAEGTAKEDLPLAKYPETVTVHLGGKMNPNAKIPEGMSFEDNSYTRLLKDDLNIEVVYDWVASMSDYDEKMSLCIGSNTVPEIMNVNAAQYRALLKYDMIQPLDEFKDKIFHVHYKDIKLYPERLNDCGIMAYPLDFMSPKIPGLGDVDWGRYVSALTDIGYNGYSCIEIEDKAFESSREMIEKALVLSQRYLRQYVI